MNRDTKKGLVRMIGGIAIAFVLVSWPKCAIDLSQYIHKYHSSTKIENNKPAEVYKDASNHWPADPYESNEPNESMFRFMHEIIEE